MKKQVFFFVLFVASFGFSQQLPIVKATIDTANIRIGEQFNLKISVDETENVILPSLLLNGLEIIDSTRVDTIKNSLIRKYILTGFDSGAFYIPQQQIFVKNQAHFTDSLLINVATIEIDTTKIEKFPIKSIKSEPVIFDDYKVYVYFGIACLLIILFWIYIFVIKKRKNIEERSTYRIIPPLEEAMMKFSTLDEKLLWQNNKTKEYYSELTEIVKRYVERELKVPTFEKTTDEIMETLVNFNDSELALNSKETINKLRKLLQKSDLVKFAKSKPLSHKIEGDRKTAEDIVHNLKLKPITEDEDLE